MKNLKVTFKCCNTEHVFTKLREFKSCTCGKCAYDSGDGFYSRCIGPRELIKITTVG